MMKSKINLFIQKFIKTDQIRSVCFTPYSQISFRFTDSRVELLGDTLSPNGSISLFRELLGDSFFEILNLQKTIVAEIKVEDTSVAVEGLMTEEGITFSLIKKDIVKSNIDDYPQMITNFLNIGSGLLLGVHKKSFEIQRMEREIFAKKLAQNKQTSVFIRTERELPFLSAESFVINIKKTKNQVLDSVIQDIDLVRYGLIENQSDIDNINLYLSSGSFVLAHIHASKVSEAMVYLLSKLKTWESRYLMSQSLIGFYSFLNWTQDQKLNYAFEVYPMGPTSKNKFYVCETKDYFQFFENDFKSNGLSFSQSLHTKVLKRSIDLRKAFEITPDPSDLDYILKKSGI